LLLRLEILRSDESRAVDDFFFFSLEKKSISLRTLLLLGFDEREAVAAVVAMKEEVSKMKPTPPPLSI